MAKPIESLDANFAADRGEDDLTWHDIRTLGVEGRGWDDTESYYDRLPARAKGRVPDPVWHLSQCSAGMYVRFVTDAPTISARWTVRFPSMAMDHMPATGASGVDLYGLHEGRWHFAGVGRKPVFPSNQAVLVTNMTSARRTFVLNLPLYNGVESVEVGVPAGATIDPAPEWESRDPRPICFYGTSINQGGCASRPGMTHTLILGRRLHQPTMNLGFSGNARCEIELAHLLAELDPSVYVLDPLPNMQEPQVTERIEPFVKTLREARPTTPIVLVEHIIFSSAVFDQGQRARYETANAACHASYQRLCDAGVADLHCVKGDALLGQDGDGTVDGVHPTDLGFARMADVLEPVLRNVLP